MPMIPEAIVAVLACARIGAVHSVVFGGFAPNELATRIDDAMPKVIVSASCGIEPTRLIEYKPLLDKARRLSKHKPDCCIVLQRPQLQADLNQPGDVDWQDAVASAVPHDCYRSRRQIRSTCCTPPAPPANRKASSAITADMP
jgi:propionyl-CoA synthetase